jgi:peptide/nickel transport system permease protein
MDAAEISSPQGDIVIKKKLGVLFWVCAGWIGLTVAAAIAAPWIGIQNPTVVDYNHFVLNGPMSAAHWFGTNDGGQDIFARTVYGARISMEVSFGSMLLASLVGGTLAVLAAYKGGLADMISNSVMTLILAFPAALAVIALLSFWRPTTPSKLMLIIGISGIPLIFRVVRGATLAVARKEYVLAAHVQGAKTPRILAKEIVPAIWPTALAFFLLGVASVIMLEGALAFLGLSVQTPVFSWGTLLNDARQKIYPPNPNFNMLIWPCLDMVLFILSLNFIGDRLRTYFEITEGKL